MYHFILFIHVCSDVPGDVHPSEPAQQPAHPPLTAVRAAGGSYWSVHDLIVGIRTNYASN